MNEKARLEALRLRASHIVKALFADDVTTIPPLSRTAFLKNELAYEMGSPSFLRQDKMLPVESYIESYFDKSKKTPVGVEKFFRDGDRIAVVTQTTEDVQALSLRYPDCFFEQVDPNMVNSAGFEGKGSYDRVIAEGMSERINKDSTPRLMAMLKEGGVLRASMAEGKLVHGRSKRLDVLVEAGNVVLKPKFADRKIDVMIAIKPWKK